MLAFRRVTESRLTPYALLLLFLGLSVWQINKSSTWLDESYTIVLVRPHRFVDIARLTSVDGHPPLWYWNIRVWFDVFGANLMALRAQSVVFMVAACAAWFHFVRTRFSRPLAVLTLALLVTNPMMLRYSIDGRMYACSILLVTATFLLLTSTWRWRWYAYWFIAVAMLYIHYFLSFVVFAEWLYLLFVLRKPQQLKIWWVMAYGASIVAAFVPWLPFAIHQTSTIVSTGFWIGPVMSSTPLSYVLLAFLDRSDPETADWRVFPALVFLFLWGAALCRASRDREIAAPRALLWLVAFVPWACLFLLSCKPLIPIFHPRYVIFGLPALLTLLAIGTLRAPGRWRALTIVVLLAGQSTGFLGVRHRGNGLYRGQNPMKRVAHEAMRPIDGEVPWVVATWVWGFLDARATMPVGQRVVWMRDQPPGFHGIEALLYGKPELYIHDWSQVTANHVWLIEPETDSMPVPPGWTLSANHKWGYARVRRFDREAVK
jgi:4-amino-4-deoxy-L-arabinose transferase-like glycosyltransferase